MMPKAMDVGAALVNWLGVDDRDATGWQHSLMAYADYDLDLMESAIERAKKLHVRALADGRGKDYAYRGRKGHARLCEIIDLMRAERQIP